MTETQTLVGHALALSRLLPREARTVRRALRTASHWGAFPMAYSAEHHALGLLVLGSARGAREHYYRTGRLPAEFTAAVRQLVRTLEAEGLNF